jgi:hypothetical protein
MEWYTPKSFFKRVVSYSGIRYREAALVDYRLRELFGDRWSGNTQVLIQGTLVYNQFREIPAGIRYRWSDQRIRRVMELRNPIFSY